MSKKVTGDIQKLKASKGALQFPQQTNSWGIAVSPIGNIFVCDCNTHQIHVFDAQRNHVKTFSGQGTGPGQLSNPRGLASSADGLLFVANQNNCVDTFREDGTFVRRIGQGQIQFPLDVTVHTNGQVYVADTNNHRVAVLTQNGQLVRTFGSYGSGAGQFSSPNGIAISPDGQLYVSDYNNSRVQVFTADGTYVREFGQGQFNSPIGLTFTTEGNVVVARNGNSCVSIFNQEGQLVHTLNVNAPRSVSFDQNGDLLVVTGAYQVEIY